MHDSMELYKWVIALIFPVIFTVIAVPLYVAFFPKKQQGRKQF